MSETNPKMRLVSKGRRAIPVENGKTQLYTVWHHLTPENTIGEVALWKKVTGRCGLIYEVEHKEGNTGSIYPKTMRYVGPWPDETQVAEWKAEEQIDVTAHAMDKQAADFEQWECLAPLRRAYQKTNATGRAALLACVIQYIQRGFPK